MKIHVLNGTQPKEEKRDKQGSNYELVKRTEIKNTPFTIVTTENRSFGTLGNYKITDDYDTIEEVEKELSKVTWNRIIQVIMILGELKEVHNLIKEK